MLFQSQIYVTQINPKNVNKFLKFLMHWEMVNQNLAEDGGFRQFAAFFLQFHIVHAFDSHQTKGEPFNLSLMKAVTPRFWNRPHLPLLKYNNNKIFQGTENGTFQWAC